MMVRISTAVLVLMLTATLARTARAESVDGRLRLSLEGTVFQTQSFTITPDGEEDVGVSDTTFGFLAGGFGAGVGFGLGDYVLLGGRLQFANTSRTFDDDNYTSVESSLFSIDALVEVLLTRGSVRVFAAPLVGYQSATSTNDEVSESSSALLFGGALGVHVFAADSFSIDPALTFAYFTGSGELDEEGYDQHGFTIVGAIALSGWLGGSFSRGQMTVAAPAHRRNGNATF